MNSPVVVLISSRFWPIVGETESIAQLLVNQLCDLQRPTTVLTGQWVRRWSEHFQYRTANVCRLRTTSIFGAYDQRFVRASTKWLKQHRDQVEAVIIVDDGHVGWHVAHASCQLGISTVVRAHPNSIRQKQVPCPWTSGPHGHELHIVAPSQAIATHLESAFGLPDMPAVHVIADPRPPGRARTARMQAQARDVLADTHLALKTNPGDPLVVWAGDFDCRQDLERLLEAWSLVIRRVTSGRLWMIGDGPYYLTILRRVMDDQLAHSVVLPGAFDDLEDVLVAADAVVCPSRLDWAGPAIPQALSYGLPVVAMDGGQLRSMVGQRNGSVLVAGALPTDLAAAMLHLLESGSLANIMGQPASDRFSDERPNAALQYLHWISPAPAIQG